MKHLSILIAFFLLVACDNQTSETVKQEAVQLEGDLYYPLLKFGSFYQLPDSIFQAYSHFRDSIGIDELKNSDIDEIARLSLLEEHDLLHSPYIFLLNDSAELLTIFMSNEEYRPITNKSYQKFIDTNKKLRLKITARILTDKVYINEKIDSIYEVDGKTLARQKKFKVHEYK